MRLTDPTLYRKLFFNPELAAGEAYMDGRLSFENSTLRDFLTLFSINRLSLGTYPLQKVLRRISRGLKRFQQANPIGKAQQNVAHHYDLGNDFYKLFLDEGMQYSCAYFLDDDDTLEEAQQNKLRLIAAKLNLKPGLKILDIGSGWGDLALYLGAHGERRRDRRHALEGAACAGQREGAQRGPRRSRALRAARLPRGRRRRSTASSRSACSSTSASHHYDEFFAKVNELLTDDGVMLLHSIGHMSPPGTASPWLRKYIFPGAYSPALSEVFTAVEQNEPVGDGPRVPARCTTPRRCAHW